MLQRKTLTTAESCSQNWVQPAPNFSGWSTRWATKHAQLMCIKWVFAEEGKPGFSQELKAKPILPKGGLATVCHRCATNGLLVC